MLQCIGFPVLASIVLDVLLNIGWADEPPAKEACEDSHTRALDSSENLVPLWGHAILSNLKQAASPGAFPPPTVAPERIVHPLTNY